MPTHSGPERRALAAALDQLVADGFPGAVAYGRVDDRRWQVAAGVADRITGARARPDDRFRIASNTKAFVSTVLLQLVGEGRLTLDDPVERWLPGVVRGNGNDGSTITVRQLLNHTSGIWDPTGQRSFWAPYLDEHDWDRVIPPRTVIAAAMAHRPDFAPGTSWGYSNTNYLLAGLVIEAVTGRGAANRGTAADHRAAWPESDLFPGRRPGDPWPAPARLRPDRPGCDHVQPVVRLDRRGDDLDDG